MSKYKPLTTVTHYQENDETAFPVHLIQISLCKQAGSYYSKNVLLLSTIKTYSSLIAHSAESMKLQNTVMMASTYHWPSPGERVSERQRSVVEHQAGTSPAVRSSRRCSA